MTISEVFDAAIDIEKRLSNLYYKFSNLFRDNSEVYNFWIKIADHEKSHCETLTLCKGCQSWGQHSTAVTDMATVELLNVMIKDIEHLLKKETISLQEALDILLRIENSELNQMYSRLVSISGSRFQQIPDDSHRSVYEHMKTIKAFSDKYYKGNVPQIRVEDYKEVRKPLPSVRSDVRRKAGKIKEITFEMSYGFIEGEDGERYMFLPGDISSGTWNDVTVNKSVHFSVINLPWGARAKDIKIS